MTPTGRIWLFSCECWSLTFSLCCLVTVFLFTVRSLEAACWSWKHVDESHQCVIKFKKKKKKQKQWVWKLACCLEAMPNPNLWAVELNQCDKTLTVLQENDLTVRLSLRAVLFPVLPLNIKRWIPAESSTGLFPVSVSLQATASSAPSRCCRHGGEPARTSM